jgi:hypothetical protein
MAAPSSASRDENPERVDDSLRAAGARPDPTKLRLLLGAGGIAALSALLTAIAVPPAPAVSAPANTPAAPATVTQQRPIVYVQLAPGQSPPPGATVIDAKAPKPITIVTRVPAPAQQTVVVRTTQSGKVIP